MIILLAKTKMVKGGHDINAVRHVSWFLESRRSCCAAKTFGLMPEAAIIERTIDATSQGVSLICS
jgi:hypothetical protein